VAPPGADATGGSGLGRKPGRGLSHECIVAIEKAIG
jgi:hypothetical protein